MKPVRTLIVDDEELCRKGIRLLLEGDADFEITGECVNGEEAVHLLTQMSSGAFSFEVEVPDVTPNVRRPTQHILLDAVRRADEAGRAKDGR